MNAHAVSAALAQFFFPQRHCLLCGCLTGKPGLCESCQQQRLALCRCDICAAFLPQNGICAHCLAQRPLFMQARAALPYGGPLRDCLRSFKYLEQTWLRRPLARLLAQTYQEHYSRLRFDAVIPAPLSAARIKQRGYNQSALLSQLFAAELQLPYSPGLLTRVQNTPPLATYDGAQRRALLKRAFAADAAAAGKTLLVVDDIYTSGATINACSAVLLAAEAAQVYGLTVAAFDARWQK